MIGVRLQAQQLASLDEWIASKDDPKPSRPEAIRMILRSVLGD